MSKFITVRLLKINNKDNRKLLEGILPKAVKKVLMAGFEFRVQFVKSGKKSEFPSIVFNGEEYSGLGEIKSGISEILCFYFLEISVSKTQ